MVSALIKAIKTETAKGLYNIASGCYLTLKEEAEIIAKVFWGDGSIHEIIEHPEKPNNIDSFVYDISKAMRELDWSPQFKFEDMLYDFIKESSKNTFSFLLEKRKKILKEN